MKKLVGIICMLVLLAPSVLAESAMKRITFNSTSDLITLKGEVNDDMKDKFIEKIMTTHRKTLWIYIDSPGGSVASMNSMIEFMKYSGKKFNCVAKFAASAAFSIFQFCDKRFMLPYSGVQMSHNASGGFRGDLRTVEAQLKMWSSIINKVESEIANKIGMSLEKYRTLIANELWINFSAALKYNMVDEAAFVTCSPKLAKKRIPKSEKICSFFGGCKVKLSIVSACPLLDIVY